jgi:hypothetical protein
VVPSYLSIKTSFLSITTSFLSITKSQKTVTLKNDVVLLKNDVATLKRSKLMLKISFGSSISLQRSQARAVHHRAARAIERSVGLGAPVVQDGRVRTAELHTRVSGRTRILDCDRTCALGLLALPTRFIPGSCVLFCRATMSATYQAQSPVFEAASSGDTHYFTCLTPQEISKICSSRDDDERSVLHVAAACGHAEVRC